MQGGDDSQELASMWPSAVNRPPMSEQLQHTPGGNAIAAAADHRDGEDEDVDDLAAFWPS